MAKVYHRRNFNEEVAEHEQFEVMYETITNTATITPGKVTRSNVSNVYETADISEGGELD
jgi:hypothetical protein